MGVNIQDKLSAVVVIKYRTYRRHQVVSGGYQVSTTLTNEDKLYLSVVVVIRGQVVRGAGSHQLQSDVNNPGQIVREAGGHQLH
jgi:hypothetical protein